MNFRDRLINYFKAAFPCVAIQTTEEARALADCFEAARQLGRSVVTWSASEGARVVLPSVKDFNETKDLTDACKLREKDCVFVLRDPHTWPFERDPYLSRAFRDFIAAAPGNGSTIVILAPEYRPHATVERLVTVLDYALPSKEDLTKIAEGIRESAGEPSIEIGEDVLRALGGLSTSESENALALSFVETGKFDPAVIYREKIQSVRRGGLLDLVEADPRGLAAVGGLDALKAWIERRKDAWSPEAEAFGLPSPKGILLVGVPGCLAGETALVYQRGSRVSGREISLRDFYLKFNGLPTSTRPWVDRAVPTFLHSLGPDGNVFYNRVVSVIESGVKPLLRVSMSDGSTLRLTQAHPIAALGGRFVAAGDLSVGDTLLARGSMKPIKGAGRNLRARPPRIIVSVKYHPTAPRKTIVEPTSGVAYDYGCIARSRLVVEAHMNGLAYDAYVDTLKQDPAVSATFRTLPSAAEVHHIDENTLNDGLENLVVLSKVDHARSHGKVENFDVEYVREVTVTAIEDDGEAMTYDVQMAMPANNFVANGVIVHNTGKSLSAKAIGTALGVPTVRLDVGSLFNSLVGESEARTRDALKLAEAMAPCVTGETIISMADGALVPIRDLVESFEPGNPPRVVCWNERTGTMNTTIVQAVTRRRADVYEVSCALGFTVKSTGNHPHLVLRGGQPEWVPTEEIEAGDMIAVPTAGLPGDADATRFWPSGLREVDGQLRRGRGGFMDSRIPRLPEQVTPGLAWAIAAVSDGDGYLATSGSIGFTSSEVALLDKFEAEVAEAFGAAPSRRLMTESGRFSPYTEKEGGITSTKDCFATSFGSKLAQDFIRSAWSASLSFPTEARAAAVASLIDSDGTVTDERISIAMKSEVGRRAFHARALVLSLGAVPGRHSGGGLYICGAEAVKLARRLLPYIVHPDKRRRMAALAEREALFTRGTGFKCGSVLRDARVRSGRSHSEVGLSTSMTWGIENGVRPAQERQLREIVSRLGDEASTGLQRLLDNECRWVSVTSVEPVGEDDVYDLVCTGDDTRSFVANLMITHNCVLWIDEIDKGLAGSSGSGSGDSGVTKRVFGAVISWMQERRRPVFLVATANDVTSLPPEFLRKGRFDEIFAVDLPTLEEREAILAIHLGKRGRKLKGFDLPKVASATANFTGSEIEAVLDEGLFSAFFAKRELKTDDLVEAARKIVPLAETAKEQIAAIREWAKTRARFASEKTDNNATGETRRKLGGSK